MSQSTTCRILIDSFESQSVPVEDRTLYLDQAYGVMEAYSTITGATLSRSFIYLHNRHGLAQLWITESDLREEPSRLQSMFRRILRRLGLQIAPSRAKIHAVLSRATSGPLSQAQVLELLRDWTGAPTVITNTQLETHK